MNHRGLHPRPPEGLLGEMGTAAEVKAARRRAWACSALPGRRAAAGGTRNGAGAGQAASLPTPRCMEVFFQLFSFYRCSS